MILLNLFKAIFLTKYIKHLFCLIIQDFEVYINMILSYYKEYLQNIYEYDLV